MQKANSTGKYCTYKGKGPSGAFSHCCHFLTPVIHAPHCGTDEPLALLYDCLLGKRDLFKIAVLFFLFSGAGIVKKSFLVIQQLINIPVIGNDLLIRAGPGIRCCADLIGPIQERDTYIRIPFC